MGPATPEAIFYETRQYLGSPLPKSSAQAIAIFNSLPTSVYGYTFGRVNSLSSYSNNSFTGRRDSQNVAYYILVTINVSANQAGSWGFRVGADWGYGGTMLMDGVELAAKWVSPPGINWHGSFIDASQSLTKSTNLTAGPHTLEIYGFEDVGDNLSTVQFTAPGSSLWRPLAVSSAGLDICPASSPFPNISGVTPGSVPNTGGATLTITGTNFQPGARVLLDGQACPGATVTPTQITCTAPAKPAKCGTVGVLVANPDQLSAIHPTGLFYRPPGVQLAAGVSYTTGAFPRKVVAADLDGDLKLDLVTANASGYNLSVLIGNGNGTFKAKVDYPTAASDVGVGDFNGDGKLDLVASNNGSGNVSVFIGNGDGTFKAAVNYAAPDAYAVAVGDINGDGKTDLVIGRLNAAIFSILLGRGDGTFNAATTRTVTGIAAAIRLVDLNNDQRLDIIASSGYTSQITVCRGNGDGTFQAPVNFTTGTTPEGIAVTDMDGDLRPDAVVANGGSSSVSVLLGDGTGGFGAKTDFMVGGGPETVAVADINNDGIMDIVTSNPGAANFSYLLGTGSGGTYAPAVNVATGATPAGVTVADLNGDGLPDIAIASAGTNSAQVFLQQCN